MTRSDPLPISPFTRPVRGKVALPGSKSITNRALLLAALCDGPVTLTGALFSDDTRIMAEGLRQLGFAVTEEAGKKSITVVGQGGKIPAKQATIHVGLAGTAARFLTALCAAAPEGTFHIDGVPQMRKRPMKGLVNALRFLGAKITYLEAEGFFPIKIEARGLDVNQRVEIDSSESSQLLSALLMIGPLGPSKVVIRFTAETRQPFVSMTTRVMNDFGAIISRIDETGIEITKVPGTAYRLPVSSKDGRTSTYPIEPDASAASYFLALPLAVGGSLQIADYHPEGESVQGDLRFSDILRQVGLKIAAGSAGATATAARPVPAVGAKAVREFSFRDFSDTFLTLAALAPLLDGPIRITGIAHTRKQETDRVAGMARELQKLGQKVIEADDSLEIHPQPLPAAAEPIEIETYGDHRFAMSFAILGSHDRRGDGRPWLAIRNPACSAKTFPGFFELLESLRQGSLAPSA